MLKKVFLTAAILGFSFSHAAFADDQAPTNVQNYLSVPGTIFVTASDANTGQPVSVENEVDYNQNMNAVWNTGSGAFAKFDTLNFFYMTNDGSIKPCANGVVSGSYILWYSKRNVNVTQCDANGFKYNDNFV